MDVYRRDASAQKSPVHAALYLLLFVGSTFALMANVQYAMNVRYTTIWDMPLRFLAFLQLSLLASRLARGAPIALIIATLALCALELRQYFVFCVTAPSYSLVPQELLTMLKTQRGQRTSWVGGEGKATRRTS